MRKSVNLALQGGGAHGAFTWGVLDALLDDARVRIDAISGTSAGAMNAVVLADGMRRGGNEGAREALRRFWRSVSDVARYSPVQRTLIDRFFGNWRLDHSLGFLWFDLLSRVASPYDINPLDINPLREIVDDCVDFASARECENIELFVSATNVRTGRVRVFEQHELSVDVIMASACLPQLFQAVEIAGEHYWDGGYTGNPVLFPLFQRRFSRDLIIVQINPTEIDFVPKSAREIHNRVNEVTFNAALFRELRAVEFVTRLLEEHRLDDRRYSRILIHQIDNSELHDLGASSKLNAEWRFLTHLFDIGHAAASKWLDAHYHDLGARSTVDLGELLSRR